VLATDKTDDTAGPASPSVWRGAAFNCCRIHRMIARKTLALPYVVQQAAPGNVSTRWITRAVFYRRDQTKTLQVMAASGDVRGRRLPTHAESGKLNVPITLVQLRTVKSGSPPGDGRAYPPRSVCPLFGDRFCRCLFYFRAFFAASTTLCSNSAGSSW
jgi:hypothetical protein